MKFNFYSKSDFSKVLNIRINNLSNNENRFFKLGRSNKSASPPIPANVFKTIPKDKEILYDIFSLDCCINADGIYTERKISEENALSLSANHTIYSDADSLTPYFRYIDANGQHTVWLEDTYHQIKKIELLEKLGFKSLAVNISDISAGTVINLIHTDRYRI